MGWMVGGQEQANGMSNAKMVRGCVDKLLLSRNHPSKDKDRDWNQHPWVRLSSKLSSTPAAGCRRPRVLWRRLHLELLELVRGLMQIQTDVGASRRTQSVCHGLSPPRLGHPHMQAQTTIQAWLCVRLLTAKTYLHDAAESRPLVSQASHLRLHLLWRTPAT